MSIALQAKLLRVLEDHAIEPLGTNASIAVDVRVISATHRNLGQMVKAGLFREDLYYRLNVLSLDLPPLRAREGDLPLLAQYFLNKFHRRGSAPTRVSSAAWSALSAFDFPGNVRQLGHAIEHATVMAGERRDRAASPPDGDHRGAGRGHDPAAGADASRRQAGRSCAHPTAFLRIEGGATSF